MLCLPNPGSCWFWQNPSLADIGKCDHPRDKSLGSSDEYPQHQQRPRTRGTCALYRNLIVAQWAFPTCTPDLDVSKMVLSPGNLPSFSQELTWAYSGHRVWWAGWVWRPTLLCHEGGQRINPLLISCHSQAQSSLLEIKCWSPHSYIFQALDFSEWTLIQPRWGSA